MSKDYTEDDFYNEMWELLNTIDNYEFHRIWEEKWKLVVKGT